MRKLIAMLLLLCVLAGAAAADDFGQSYDLFQSLYAENVSFINANTGRHLLPLPFSAEFDEENERIYVLNSGGLSVQIKLDDLASQIAYCQITLTAPEGMTYEESLHNNDYMTSGYQSNALLMAMSSAPTAYDRYALVMEVNSGLAANGGVYEAQVGDYRLTCRSADGVATLLFENELLMGVSIETEEEAPTVEIREQE